MKGNEDTRQIKAEKSVSASQLSDYMKCPAFYCLKHIVNIPTMDSAPKIFGSAIHRSCEYCLNYKVKYKKHLKEKTMSERFVAEYENLCKNRSIKWNTSFEKDLFRKKGHDLMIKYADVIPTLDPLQTEDGSHWIERPFEISLKDVDWAVTGRIDLVTKVKELFDFKATSKPKTVFDFFGDVQFGIYLWLFRNFFRQNPSAIYVEQFVYGSQEVKIDRVPVDLGRLYVDTVPVICQKIRKGILTGVFFPRRSILCRFCEYQTPCANEEWNI